MRTTVLSLVFLLAAGLVAAQNATADFKYGLKLSDQISYSYSRIRDTNGDLLSGGYLNLFRIMPSFLLKGSKGNFWDFTLQSVNASASGRIQSANPKSNPYNLGLNLKAGYFFAFCKQKTTHWAPMLGLELAPYVGASRTRSINIVSGSITTTPYFNTYQTAGAYLSLAPRVMWCPGKRFFMDATLNLNLLETRFNHVSSDDPVISTPSRSYFNFNMARDRIARLTVGLGIKL